MLQFRSTTENPHKNKTMDLTFRLFYQTLAKTQTAIGSKVRRLAMLKSLEYKNLWNNQIPHSSKI